MKLFLVMIFTLAMTTQPNPLATYKWKNRLLLVFAPTEKNGLYIDQTQAIEAMGMGWDDRELVLFSVFPNVGEGPKGQLEQIEINYLRQRYQIDEEDFTVILIGKDGGEKLRSVQNIVLEAQLFPLIDGMPMRKAEMLRKN